MNNDSLMWLNILFRFVKVYCSRYELHPWRCGQVLVFLRGTENGLAPSRFHN